jgi:hypothetical protein
MRVIAPGLSYGSHLPVLMRALDKTEGTILEFGMGEYSTAIISMMARLQGRKAHFFETNKEWFDYVRTKYGNRMCEFNLVENWDDVRIKKMAGFAFIDHAPDERRKEEIKRFANSIMVIAVHDSQPKADKHFRYSEVFPLFKYKRDFTKYSPHTTLLSNFVSLDDF